MKRIVLMLAASAVVSAGILTASAAASGPAPKGKEIVELKCEGREPLTVSVPRPEHSWGAGQAVGQKLHGIPTVVSFSAVDLRTGKTVVAETREKGNGHANQNQETTNCVGSFEVPASEFFEEGLPPGVEPGDTIKGTVEVTVVLKE